jgi:hypothetical protein
VLALPNNPHGMGILAPLLKKCQGERERGGRPRRGQPLTRDRFRRTRDGPYSCHPPLATAGRSGQRVLRPPAPVPGASTALHRWYPAAVSSAGDDRDAACPGLNWGVRAGRVPRRRTVRFTRPNAPLDIEQHRCGLGGRILGDLPASCQKRTKVESEVRESQYAMRKTPGSPA